LVQTASKGSKNREKCMYLIQEARKIEEHLDAMDKVIEDTGETQSAAQPTSITTVSNLFNASLQDGSSATIDLVNPDHAHTKGRPRMQTIKERIKEKRFYKCSHCGSTEHTKKSCEVKHLVFNLPKPKRGRKSKPTAAGK
jgi:lipopolysaccharide biosynthesis regulator YciM